VALRKPGIHSRLAFRITGSRAVVTLLPLRYCRR
jgi:hypothetical protein